ncbi:hypothetical protein BKA61DRAFT_693306 [Leptodontidium sp. MPI-SDFR-AT-0119]|nr:hypothetical protein BKA61DRAFT_693306 [Leptodontidium sp. MPI-SDFR-AT-0119]
MATSSPDNIPEELIQDHGPFNKGVDPQWLSEKASETHCGRSIDHWREPASAPRFPNLATKFSARFDRDSAYESMSYGANSIRSIPGSPILEYGNAVWPGSLPEGTAISSNLLLGLELYQTHNQNQVLGEDTRISSDKFLPSSHLGYEQRTQDGEIQAEFQAESGSTVLALPDFEERYQPSQCHLSGCQKGYVFETFQSYQSHIKNVHSHAIWCTFPECPHPRPFATKTNLEQHRITKHGDRSRRPYACPWQGCVKSFSRIGKLRVHEREYHGLYPSSPRPEQFESSEACAEHSNSEHVNRKLDQDVQKAEESRDQNQGLVPALNQGHASHRGFAEDMPKLPVSNHSIAKISPISKEMTALEDIEPAKMEDLNVVNAICLPTKPCYTPPVKMGSPNGSAEVGFGTISRAASDTACGSRKRLDTAEEALENSIQQHHLLSGRSLPATSSTEEDKGQEISRCLERNSNSSEGGGTDMEDQELDSRGGFLGFDSIAECQDGKLDRMRQDLLQSVLDARRQALVVKIMDEFWQIWDSDWSPGITQCASQPPSSPGDVRAPQPIVCSSAAGTARQQKRQGQDSDERDENDGNDDDFPRRPTKRTLLSGKLSSRKKFACPFRKYNPVKYSINDYYTCALTGHDTISRLKSHLYRVHSTPPYCRRCWKTFGNEGQLEAHATAPKEMICDSTLGEEPEGVTPKQAEKLRSRAHPYANQSEHDRWESIYKILFSHIEADNIPSPYFEEPREQVPQTPTSQALQQYESYVHNTVPVRFQSLVEAAVRDMMEPVEATFLRDLDIIGLTRSCLEEASREYREKHRNEGSPQPPVTAKEQPEVWQPFLETSTITTAADHASQPIASINFLDEVMQPPPPQQAHYGLDNATINRIRGNRTQADVHNVSDSAYGSGLSCICIGPCICSNSESDTQPHGWQIASPRPDHAADGGKQMLEDQTVGLDGVEEIEWSIYLEPQALSGLPG